jgi:thioredoxin 1
MSTLLIIGIVAVALSIWIGWSYNRMKKAPPVASHPAIKNLTQNNFRQMTAFGLILVDFWAPWCGPCKIVAPILNEIAEEQEGKLRIGKVNVDNQQALAAKYKVRNIPTMILFKNGKDVKRIVGAKTKKGILAEISEYLG